MNTFSNILSKKITLQELVKKEKTTGAINMNQHTLAAGVSCFVLFEQLSLNFVKLERNS